MHRHFIAGLAALTAAMAIGGPAKAASFDFSYSFPSSDTEDFPSGFTSTTGIIDAIYEGGGVFLATAISGSWNGEAITGLAPVDSEGYNDNLLYTSAPFLDVNGITFDVAGPIAGDLGDGLVNVYYTAEGYTDLASATGYSQDFTLTPTAAVPEPGTWILMLAGVALIGTALRRQQRLEPIVN